MSPKARRDRSLQASASHTDEPSKKRKRGDATVYDAVAGRLTPQLILHWGFADLSQAAVRHSASFLRSPTPPAPAMFPPPALYLSLPKKSSSAVSAHQSAISTTTSIGPIDIWAESRYYPTQIYSRLCMHTRRTSTTRWEEEGE